MRKSALTEWHCYLAIFLASMILTACGGDSPAPVTSTIGSWTATGSLATARIGHTATLLPNGKVLVAGGWNGVVATGTNLASAELYDPATGTWTATGSLATARSNHTATLLPSGKVLVAGGFNLASAELYDPATGAWTATGSLNTARDSHTATLLPNGKVLVAGGRLFITFGSGTSVELYDPATGIWTATGSLARARSSHTATLLSNGKVLVAGGFDQSGLSAANTILASTELYDPASGAWTASGSLATERDYHTATLLPNGKVLVAGGRYNIGGSAGLMVHVPSNELYDPATGAWTVAVSLAAVRWSHTATVLANGKVLVAGGIGATWFLASAELYDPATGTWAVAGSLATARDGHTATLLPNGKVLVAGGMDAGLTSIASAELYW